MGVETLDAVADRGYYAGEEICACEEAGITVMLPKPMTSNSKAAGRFGKQDFRYVAAEDAYVCPSGQRLAYSFTTKDKDLVLRRYRTNACQGCAIKGSCTTGKERLISRWEHEARPTPFDCRRPGESRPEHPHDRRRDRHFSLLESPGCRVCRSASAHACRQRKLRRHQNGTRRGDQAAGPGCRYPGRAYVHERPGTVRHPRCLWRTHHAQRADVEG